MPRPHLSATELEIGLRAVKMVACADGVFDVREKRLMEAASRALSPDGRTADAGSLRPIEPQEAADAVSSPETRARIIQAQMIMSLIDGDAGADELEVIQRFATALGVDEPRLRNMRQLVDHHHLLLKLDLGRRSRMTTDALAHAYREKGLRGAWKTLVPFFGTLLGKDHALAEKYQALGDMGPRTFGWHYFEYIRANGFGFPGEAGGFPEEFIKHDCCHVLGGYDTDPAGECQVVAFICGFMEADPFWYLFMIMVHMHLGIETFYKTPTEVGAFDPDVVMAAYTRGTKVSEDLYVPGFDWWSLFPLPIDEVRARYNIT